MAIDFFFDADQEVLGKIMYNRYAVGMAVFCLGILFNSVSMLLILTGGLIRCSTGIYLFLIAFSDTCVLVFGALMDEFYFDLINVDVFYDSDDPKALCQAVYFLRELFYYYRWFLLATMVVDGCLVISGRVGARNLAFFAVVFSVAWLLVSGGLAGYWIHFVGEILIGERQFTSGMCEITSPLPGDHESTWFYMDTIVHLILPEFAMPVIVFICSCVLLSMLFRKVAETLEPDDYTTVQAVCILGLVSFIFMVPYIVINGIILNSEKAFSEPVFDIGDEPLLNIWYASHITEKFARFVLCITFFVFLCSTRFRRSCCRD